MKITFVAKNEHNEERWSIFNFSSKDSNPFKYTLPGERIALNDLIRFIAVSWEDDLKWELKKFLRNSLMDGYFDIRYYFS